MEDVSLRLEANPATVELWQRHRALCSGLIAFLTPLAMAVTVTIGVALAAAGTPEPTTSAAKPSGELRLAMAGIGVMRPIPWQETPFSKGYFTLLYDFLIGTNADGSMSAANGAAEKWEMSADGMTWTFLLRKGITFHDGTELSAEDVKWSLEMVTKPESTRPSPHGCRPIKRSRWQTPYADHPHPQTRSLAGAGSLDGGGIRGRYPAKEVL
jgi:ABC-type transport system substrate-binding protein